jgi:hypothetical protein
VRVEAKEKAGDKGGVDRVAPNFVDVVGFGAREAQTFRGLVGFWEVLEASNMILPPN